MMRCSVTRFFLCREKKSLTFERVETATHLNPPGRFFWPFCRQTLFIFNFFFLSTVGLPKSWFNVVNNEAPRASLLGSFFKGGVLTSEGHGSRGSAGAGREAVPLCQRGRAA